MKTLSDNTVVSARSYYYLLGWNEQGIILATIMASYLIASHSIN